MSTKERTLAREVTVTQIPSGDRQMLPAGTQPVHHQTPGCSLPGQTELGLLPDRGTGGAAHRGQGRAG